MACTEAYKEHIEYTFNAFCRIVIRYAAMNAWCDRSKQRQREISFEYLTEEKYHPLSILDGLFINPYEEYPVTICGQTIMLTSGELAEALSIFFCRQGRIVRLKPDLSDSLPDRERQNFLHLFYFFISHEQIDGYLDILFYNLSAEAFLHLLPNIEKHHTRPKPTC